MINEDKTKTQVISLMIALHEEESNDFFLKVKDIANSFNVIEEDIKEFFENWKAEESEDKGLAEDLDIICPRCIKWWFHPWSITQVH